MDISTIVLWSLLMLASRVSGLQRENFESVPGIAFTGVSLKTLQEENIGCFYHGCPRCFDTETVNPQTYLTRSELYDKTLERRAAIVARGYRYVEVWECDFDKTLAEDPTLAALAVEMEREVPLNPRDAFFGGHTNAITLREVVNDLPEDSKIYYDDICSLYPFYNYYKEFPKGHTQVTTSGFADDITVYRGLLKLKVLPPRDQYFPVLPTDINGQLMFALCKTCATAEHQGPCSHTDAERAMVGTWCHPEVQEALRRGYSVLKVYEVWHWDTWGVLFRDYISTFLKLKQEAWGWREDCVTDGKKVEYLRYEEHQGTSLGHTKIAKNPGLRTVAKAKLNSMWRKFGQRATRPRLRSQATLSATLRSCWTMTSWLKTCSSSMMICWTVDANDTDSIIYTQSTGKWKPPLGNFFEDLTSELPSGDHILQFVSTGPKSYSYATTQGTVVCKVKRLHLNVRTADVVNMRTMEDLLEEGPSGSRTVPNPAAIRRDVRRRTLHTTTLDKTFRMLYSKRVICPDKVHTLHYGGLRCCKHSRHTCNTLSDAVEAFALYTRML
ncbi:uncharacterized protein LOC125572419 [Nematostella vectensis]|uniref:uncharacterized protein LOC125572419 n=1 Tax=Nematostella vectensis TaxID=45351 RepID=UPI0020770D67|nr:uncharacterized protein LOC125572419 [Nematostella vectensis]